MKKYLLTFGKHSSLYPEAELEVGEVVEVVLGLDLKVQLIMKPPLKMRMILK